MVRKESIRPKIQTKQEEETLETDHRVPMISISNIDENKHEKVKLSVIHEEPTDPGTYLDFYEIGLG